MSLEAAAQQVNESQPGPACGMGKVVDGLNQPDRAFYQVMVDGGRTSTYIAEVFRAAGHDVSDFMVRRHRAGKCSCR